MSWGIQTAYLPRENLAYMEEWLVYHLLLGAEYFYLYDNTGSTDLKLGQAIAVTGKNKYGIPMDFTLSDEEIAEIEAAILKKFPVVKVPWQPVQDGRIIHGHVASCDHFSDRMKSSWCAFIDMDEFLCSPHPIADLLEGQAVLITQKKFADRFTRPTALEITDTFTIDTQRWGVKLIVNMEHYIKGGRSVHHLNADQLDLVQWDADVLRFNHYNHNRRGHEWLLSSYTSLDPAWSPAPFEEVFTEKCDLLLKRSREIDYSKFTQAALAVRPPAGVNERQ